MSYKLAEIARATGLEMVGDGSIVVTGVAEPDLAGPEDLALAMSKNYADALSKSRARAAVVWADADIAEFGLEAALRAPRPRVALAHVTQCFAHTPDIPTGIHPSAMIGADTIIGDGAAIGPFAVIGSGTVIGEDARIAAHATIGDAVTLGARALLHAGVRIGARCTIGDDFIAQPNAVIGADGFSFEPPERGNADAARRGGEAVATARFMRIHSLAAVEIGDDVEIGAGTTVDRGTIAPTRIGSGTKVDNQVQIGHNVQIGETCLLCGQVGVAGSARIGDRVVLGGKVGVADHVTIGNDTVCAASTMVASSVPAGRVMMGVPATERDKAVAQFVALKRLPRMIRQMAEVRSKLGL